MSAAAHARSTAAAAAGGESATRIGRNFTFRMAAQVVSALLNVGSMVMLGNYLDVEGYGQFVFYYALIPIFGSLSDLGTGVMITKAIARDRLNGARHFGDAILLKLSISLVLLAGLSVAAWIAFPQQQALLITLVAVIALVDFGQDVAVWVVRANERLDLEAVLLLLSQVAWVGGLAVGILLHAPIAALFAIKVVAFLVRTAVSALWVRKSFYRPAFQVDLARLKALILEALPFGFAMLFVVLYGRIGVLMLQALATSTDVALFNVGYMLSQPLGFISTALSMAAFPALARRAQRGDDAIHGALVRTSKYQIVVTLPLMVGLYLLAPRIIPLLFHGADFARAGFALQLMSLGLTFIFVNLMSRYLLAALDRQRTYLTAVVAGLVTNLGIGWLLIPGNGFAGACIALLAGEVAILVVCQTALTRWVRLPELLGIAARPAVAALGMAGVLLALMRLPWPVGLAIGSLTYVALLFALRVFTEEELRIMRGVYASFRLPGSAALEPGRTTPVNRRIR